MRKLKKIFDWYINASLHVALATTALVGITNYYSKLPFDVMVVLFVFCATVSSYNIIKYAGYILSHTTFKNTLKLIVALTLVCLLVCAYGFLNFKPATRWAIVVFGLLNLLYVGPLGSKQLNLRNAAGIKIYIVSDCCAGVTLLVPLLEAGMGVTTDVVLKFFQRFILTLILILIFEIRDLKYDDYRLKTVPQSIGISATKNLIYLLSILFYVLDFFKTGSYPWQGLVNALLIGLMVALTYYVTPNRSKYYTLFYAESVPVIWYALIVLFSGLTP